MAAIASTSIDAVVYRATSLKYYSKGLSPAGSRMAAGRFNRQGVSALYLSTDPETAIAEYSKRGPRPLVLLPVALRASDLVDLSKAHGRWPGTHWGNWRCDWEAALSVPAGDCDSWRCGDDAIKRRFSGIYFPSLARRGGWNVVLFTEDAVPGTLEYPVIDPAGEIRAANPADPH